MADLDPAHVESTCGWWIGPVWKDGGGICVCIEPIGHPEPHRCSCGAWFERCGHPPWESSSEWHDHLVDALDIKADRSLGACPACGAKPGARCLTKNGKRRGRPHAARTNPKEKP